MNWLALLSSVKGFLSKVTPNEVAIFALGVTLGLASYQLYQVRDELYKEKEKVVALTAELKSVKDSNEVLTFSSTVDGVLCQQAVEDERKKLTEVNRGVTRIRMLRGPLMDEAIPTEIVKTLNETREGQLK